MKIALIGTAHPYRGGIAAFNERLAKELIDEGHEVDIYTFKLQYPNFLFPGKTQYSTEPKPTYLNIIRNINSINPLNWIKTGFYIKKQNYDLAIVPFWLPFMAASLGTIIRILKGRTIQVISIAHNIVPHESRLGDKLLINYFVKGVDGFLSMTKKVLDDLNLFDKESTKVLSPHPIYDNFGQIQTRKSALEFLGFDPKFKYVLFFGLIRDYKGLDLLLEAFANKDLKQSEVKLIIAGEYYCDKTPYKNLIKKHNIQKNIISIEKFIPDSEVRHYFNACHLVVQPYKSATQSGVTQIAYHFNKPMIVTNVGGLQEMCPDGKVGYVVEPNSDAIKEAIMKFFSTDKQQEIVNNIKEEKKKYSWSIFTKNLLSLIEIDKTES